MSHDVLRRPAGAQSVLAPGVRSEGIHRLQVPVACLGETALVSFHLSYLTGSVGRACAQHSRTQSRTSRAPVLAAALLAAAGPDGRAYWRAANAIRAIRLHRALVAS